MAQRSQPRSTTVLLSVTALATVLVLSRNRRLRQWFKSLVLFEPLASSTATSAQHDDKDVYEAVEDPHGVSGLDAVCNALEEQIAEAKARSDHRAIRRLRRVLCRLYDAMDIAQGTTTPRPELTRSVNRWAARCQAAEDEVCSEDSFQSASPHAQLATLPPHAALSTTVLDVVPSTPEPELTSPTCTTPVYLEAMQLVNEKQVEARKDRTLETECQSREDFLARLHCVRLASTLLMRNPEKRRWVSVTGRAMIGHVLRQAQCDIGAFEKAWDVLQAFIEDKLALEEYAVLTKDLTSRGCKSMSLFDCVIDFVLLDAFDDMKRLPSSVQAVLNNTWVPRAVKEQTLSTAIWSVLSTRKAMCDADGLMVRFYGIMEHVSPVLACGLLGCHSVPSLQDMLTGFKDVVLEATAKLFNFDEKTCLTPEDLVQHMEVVLRECEAKAKALC